jgi:hypothetical protein
MTAIVFSALLSLVASARASALPGHETALTTRAVPGHDNIMGYVPSVGLTGAAAGSLRSTFTCFEPGCITDATIYLRHLHRHCRGTVLSVPPLERKVYAGNDYCSILSATAYSALLCDDFNVSFG